MIDPQLPYVVKTDPLDLSKIHIEKLVWAQWRTKDDYITEANLPFDAKEKLKDKLHKEELLTLEKELINLFGSLGEAYKVFSALKVERYAPTIRRDYDIAELENRFTVEARMVIRSKTLDEIAFDIGNDII